MFTHWHPEPIYERLKAVVDKYLRGTCFIEWTTFLILNISYVFHNKSPGSQEQSHKKSEKHFYPKSSKDFKKKKMLETLFKLYI